MGKDDVVAYSPDNDESITEAIVTAVSENFDTDLTELQPLYSVVDPDALENLFAPPRSGPRRNNGGHVVFSYGPYLIRVESDGSIAITEEE